MTTIITPNRKAFLIPSIPDTFVDLVDAREVVRQLIQTISDIVQSLQITAVTIGDFVGPSVAVDSNIVEFDTTTGKLGKDGGLTHANISAGLVPVGAMITWPTETPPSGWLERNGASLDRTTYAALFAVIGTIYGTADANHFNLPDHRGRFPRYWDHAKTLDPDRATRTAVSTTGATMTAGDHVGTEQVEGFKAHTHTKALGSSMSATFAAGQTMLNNAATWDLLTGSTGDNETRPVNVYEMPIIKY